MPILKITKKVKNGHQHIVYLRDDGTGFTSNEEHTHPIAWGIIQPVKNHTHEIIDYVPSEETKDKRTEKEIVSEQLLDYKECFDYERDARIAGKKAEDMYSHKQWEGWEIPEDKTRAALTINVLEDKIDVLTGYQRQNRTDITYLPSEKGDAFGADIANIVSKKILNNCYYQREKSKVFEDEGVIGRGLFNMGVDYEKDVQGIIFVERFKWNEAFFAPHEKEDLSDCELMFKTKWYSEQKIKALYPERFLKMDSEQKIIAVPLDINEDNGLKFAEYELIDKNAKKYRLLERWKKEYNKIDVLVNATDGFVFAPIGWMKDDINKAKTIQGMTTIKRESYRMKITRTISNVFLEDFYVDDKDFEVVPIYGKFRNGKFWGKIEGVKDLQRLINKTYSQFIDIISRCALYIRYYDSETFPNENVRKNWEKTASIPGSTHEVSDINKIPVKEEGIKFPNEIVNAIELFARNLREIMNVNLSLQGMQSEQQSGVAMRQKIVQQLIGNDFLFDNMSFGEQLLAKLLLKKIQKHYTPERIIRIIEHENIREKKTNPQGVQIAGQAFDEYPREEIMNLLKTVDFTEYDVDIGESPDAPSAMMGAFLMCLEAARAGAPIPPDIFISLYPIPEALKAQIMQSLQAAQQAEAQKDQLKYGTEIEKAKIAQSGKMLDKNPMQQIGGGIMPNQGVV